MHQKTTKQNIFKNVVHTIFSECVESRSHTYTFSRMGMWRGEGVRRRPEKSSSIHINVMDMKHCQSEYYLNFEISKCVRVHLKKLCRQTKLHSFVLHFDYVSSNILIEY